MLNHCIITATSKPTITVEPRMIERSTTSIMVVKNSDQGDSSNHNGARREEEEGEEGGRRIFEGTVGYSEDTVGTVREQ